jgi:hypothetical protein
MSGEANPRFVVTSLTRSNFHHEKVCEGAMLNIEISDAAQPRRRVQLAREE